MIGQIHVYTGDGKGKTTAAFGLALRAAGAGLNVFIAQFLKKGDYSELNALTRFSDCIAIEQFGLGRFIKGVPEEADMQVAEKGIQRIETILSEGKHQVVILDEANVAVSYGLIKVEQLLALIEQKPDQTELIITGRGASPAIIERADLVTEMKAVKHYFEKGVQARIGIEK